MSSNEPTLDVPPQTIMRFLETALTVLPVQTAVWLWRATGATLASLHGFAPPSQVGVQPPPGAYRLPSPRGPSPPTGQVAPPETLVQFPPQTIILLLASSQTAVCWLRGEGAATGVDASQLSPGVNNAPLLWSPSPSPQLPSAPIAQLPPQAIIFDPDQTAVCLMRWDGILGISVHTIPL